MKDETQHAFDVKANPIYGRIENSDLEQAAQYALLEAGKWDDAVSALQRYKNRFDSQICVMTAFSIELYLKALLMMKGVNVTIDFKKHHICRSALSTR